MVLLGARFFFLKTLAYADLDSAILGTLSWKANATGSETESP